mgnify:FL=1
MYTEEQASYINKQAEEIIKLKYDCNSQKKEGILIKKVCDFFDVLKDFELTQPMIQFLYKFANIVGVPQYFDMLLEQKNNNLKLDDIHLQDLIGMIYNASLAMEDNRSFHKYQKIVYDKFQKDSKNRYFLTAPTSFGKTFIVNEIIKKMRYSNVVLIYPTLSLLAENYIKLLNDDFFNEYHIHTLSDENVNFEENNLFIFTPERFLSMTDKTDRFVFDFIFMDEIYKIDNQFILDNDTVGENERDLSFRVALQLVCKRSKDILLAGPYIEIANNNASSIQNFFNDNGFKPLSFNEIEIVNKSILNIDDKMNYQFEGLNFKITSKPSKNKLKSILKTLYDSGNNSSIIYTDARHKTEQIAKWIIQFKEDLNIQIRIEDFKLKERFSIFMEHIKNSFSEDWILYKALQKGIGIHHGYVPKYIQKEIIDFFNARVLDTIISTTTITEGINTSAKSMIVMSDKKGTKTLKKFDAQNIAGRAGRFMYHFKGFVFAVDNSFNQILNSESEELKNLEYDKNSHKSEVDIMMSSEKYLTEEQKLNKQQLIKRAKDLELDMNVIKKFKTIKLSDKIKLYEIILKLPDYKKEAVKFVLNYGNRLNWDNFEVLLECIYPIIENDDLKKLIESKTKRGFSALTVKVANYLTEGFPGVLKYELERKSTDSAVKETSKLTFNIFKYHLVKYLGLIDILLKYNIAKQRKCNVDDISSSVTSLISLLEYSCTNSDAKRISDYGVPFKVIKYLDSLDRNVYNRFDKYEYMIYQNIKTKFKI